MALMELTNLKKKMNTRPTLKLIDIEDIEFNELNKFDIKDIEELKTNIYQYGLLKPLEVYCLDDGNFKLIGGHRRLKALLQLFNSGLIEAEVPCLIYQAPEEAQQHIDERLQMIVSNGQREMSLSEKVKITKELLDILNLDPAKKEPRIATRDWVAGFLGCSARTAQKYINSAQGKQIQKKENHVNELRSLGDKIDPISLDKIINLFEMMNKKVNEMFWLLSDEDKKRVVDISHNKDITLEKMISKLASITDLYVKSLKNLER